MTSMIRPKKREYHMTPSAIISRKWNQRNPDKIEVVKQRNKNMRLLVMDILGGRVCVTCGYDENTRALQLDHIDDKGHEDRYHFTNIWSMYSFYLKNPEITREKLQVLCANCNTIKQSENNIYQMSRREQK